MLNNSENSNIIIFTLHKCASMFIAKLCADLSQKNEMIFLSPNGGDIHIEEKFLASNTKTIQGYSDFIKNGPGAVDLAFRFLAAKRPWNPRRGLTLKDRIINSIIGINKAVVFAKNVRKNFNVYRLCFAPIRFYSKIPKNGNFSIILHLRDPRDILVSMFYSYCYMHPGPEKGYTGYRKRVADEGIDKFVVKLAKKNYLKGDYGTGGNLSPYIGSLLTRYENYIMNFASMPNIIIVKYEDMATNFQSWIKKVIVPFKFQNQDKIINDLVTKYAPSFKRKKEDIWSHKRKITPGDYKNKLRSETIDELNDIFKDILEKFDYEII